MSDLKNNLAWQKIFNKHKIINEIETKGQFIISSSDINEFREARLMTKFDYKSQLPQIFVDNNFSVLPISRGNYIISNFETFKNFEDNDVEITKMNFPSYLESIDYNNITSESIALNCAYVSGIIEEFTGDEELVLTISGRMSSSLFNFNIDSKNGLLEIKVENAQIEIDGGYEGYNSLNLIEAKNSISKDFLIRQIYYPYKLWEKNITKNVRPIFLTYTNGIFHFREYSFKDPGHYNSLELIREKKYMIREGAINTELIIKVLNETSIIEEPEIAFPQANSFDRVINICEILNENDTLNKEEITSRYDFDERQTNYYTDAGRYLGLIEKKNENTKIIYFLTNKGKKLFQLSIIDRQLEFVKIILSHLAFNKTLKLYFDKADIPESMEVINIMKSSNLYKIESETTFFRRSSTILSWINWILELIEE